MPIHPRPAPAPRALPAAYQPLACPGYSCHTIGVTFHETFWVVGGTAAPVIALAAIVSVKDLIKDSNAIMDPVRPYIGSGTDDNKRKVNRYMSQCDAVSAVCIFGQLINVCLQAFVLTISLLSIADQSNVIPIWIGIAAPVTGVLWLAVAELAMILEENSARTKLAEITSAMPLTR